MVAEHIKPIHFLRGRAPAMLILGDPGAGKTVLLLELLHDLLADAVSDQNYPLPVLFRLAAWTASDHSLEEWLHNQLCVEPYGIGHDLAREWISGDQILPLLDGLDEVAPEHRVRCMRAIDAFREAHGSLPLVVTSRTGGYKATGRSMRAQVALVAQPLDRPQVDEYLERFGMTSAGLREALSADDALRQLLQNPFWLSVAVRAFANLPSEQVGVGQGSLSEWRSHLCSNLVRRALSHRRYQRAFDEHCVMRWLAYMARAMALRLDPIFRVDFITKSWLGSRQRYFVTAGTRVLSLSLAGAAVYALASQVDMLHENQGSAFHAVWSLFFAVSVISCIGAWVTLRNLRAGEHPGARLPKAGLNRKSTLLNAAPSLIYACFAALVASKLNLSSALFAVLEVAADCYFVMGGRKVISHWWTRVLLAKDGLAPLRYGHLLEYVISKSLLLETGNGYAFQHRFLLEYFAGLELANIPQGSEQGGLPLADMRPEAVLQSAIKYAEEGEWDKTLSALRYASRYLPPGTFSPTAIKVTAMVPAEEADRLIAAHRLVVEAGDPEFSPQAALRLADIMANATHRDPYVEQEWLKIAKEFYQIAADSGHPDHAEVAVDRLASGTFTVAWERLREWDIYMASLEAIGNTARIHY